MSKKGRTKLAQGFLKMLLGDNKGGFEDVVQGADNLGFTEVIDRMQGGSGCDHSGIRTVHSDCGYQGSVCDCGYSDIVNLCDRCVSAGKEKCPFD